MHARIKKIVKFNYSQPESRKSFFFFRILCQNHENHENLSIQCQHSKKNENPRTPRQNYENHENLIISRQNHEDHEILKFHYRIMIIIKKNNYSLQE